MIARSRVRRVRASATQPTPISILWVDSRICAQPSQPHDGREAQQFGTNLQTRAARRRRIDGKPQPPVVDEEVRDSTMLGEIRGVTDRQDGLSRSHLYQ